MKTLFSFVLLFFSVSIFADPKDKKEIKRPYVITSEFFWHMPPNQVFTGKNFYGLILGEITPYKRIKLNVEATTELRLLEVDWRVNDWLEMRAGRIWIPFDDMKPGSPFGGLINLYAFAPSGVSAFLPDLFSDMGVAFRFILSRDEVEASEAHLYVVNGLQDDGIDPIHQSSSYPNLGPGVPPISDNNSDKGIGARIRMVLNKTISYAASFYTARFSKSAETSSRVTMVGVDSQYRPLDFMKLKAGYSVMFVGLPPGSQTEKYLRAGLYFSVLTQVNEKIKISLMTSATQPDSRVTNLSDRFLFGGYFSYLPLPNIETSFLYFRDFNQVEGKTIYNSFGLRFLMVY